MTYILLIIGFGLLIKGADYFVKGSTGLAELWRVPPLLIGLTIVSFGTSSPEAAVSITAAIKGSSDISVGNVIGSNIFMITMVIGLTAFILPLKVENETIRKEIPFTLLASFALLILISDSQFHTMSQNLITRSDGFILLLFFCVFLYYIYEVARSSREFQQNQPNSYETSSWVKHSSFTLSGLAAIILGGYLVVQSSTQIALAWGMSETLVGLTIAAIGTSLPELVTSIVAAYKKQGELALGNIVGSNIFNILFVLGLASVIHPLLVESKIFIDILIMILLTLLLLIFSRTEFKIAKSEGLILAFTYVVYLIFIIWRN